MRERVAARRRRYLRRFDDFISGGFDGSRTMVPSGCKSPALHLLHGLARVASDLTLDVPPQRARSSWAAIASPRFAWRKIDEIATGVLKDFAEKGISEIVAGTFKGS